MAGTHFDVLGLAETATTSDVRRAYRLLAREHHPDVVLDPAKKARAEKLFTEITEAFNVLSNPARRSAYEQSLRQSKSGEKQGVREAKTHFRMGIQQLEDNDVEAAVRSLRSAIHLEPEPATYYAHLAMALDRASKSSDASRAWDEAIKRDPSNASYHRQAGACLEKGGLRTRARRMYETAVQLDANDAEAAQGVERLTDNPKKAGVLGGLFKKA